MRLICGVLGFNAQAYFARTKNALSCQDLLYAITTLIDANDADPAFEFRFIVDALERIRIEIGEGRAWRLCSHR